MKKVRVAIGIAAAITPATLALTPGVANAMTRQGPCTNHHWMHFRNEFTRASFCFGFNGGTWSGRVVAEKICGGNNWGWYSGYNSDGGRIKHATFYQGSMFALLPNLGNAGEETISKVHISNWSGSNSCFI